MYIRGAPPFISPSLFTGSAHVQTSLPGIALSGGGREELRGFHVTRGQLCQVSFNVFMLLWDVGSLCAEETVYEPGPRAPSTGGVTAVLGKCFFCFKIMVIK